MFCREIAGFCEAPASPLAPKGTFTLITNVPGMQYLAVTAAQYNLAVPQIIRWNNVYGGTPLATGTGGGGTTTRKVTARKTAGHTAGQTATQTG